MNNEVIAKLRSAEYYVEDFGLLGCYAVWQSLQMAVFQRSIDHGTHNPLR
jgi:hypothetical protein